MAKSRTSKAETLGDIEQALAGAKGVVFANFAGLNVKATTELRRQCRAANVKYAVAKKTLLKLAFEKANVSGVNPRDLSGGVAVVIGYEDEVGAAKLLHSFAAKNEALQFVGGLISDAAGWHYLDKSGVTQLAKLPSKNELLGQMVGSLNSPLTGLVGVLAGTVRSFVQVLKAMEGRPQ